MSLVNATIAVACPAMLNIDIIVTAIGTERVFASFTGRAVTQRMRTDICVASASCADRVSGAVHKFDQSPKGQAENGDLLNSNMLHEHTSLRRGVKEKS